MLFLQVCFIEEAGMALFELCDVTVSYSDLLSPQSDGPTSRGEDVSKADRASQQSSVLPVNDVSLALDAGCIYDLTGPSGSGKTTLLRACARLLPLQGGTMLLDGQDFRTFEPTEWRQRIALVPQKATLIPGTVRDNLLLPWTLTVRESAPRPKDDYLEQCLEDAKLEVGLSRNAAQLSGGQAARVALLRVLVTKPQVLLLDEVDASLDDESARAVGNMIVRFVGNKACALRIRHRPNDGLAKGTHHLEAGKLTYSENA